MSNRAEYLALTRLKANPDYQVLEGKWLYVISRIELEADKAANKNGESNWRYYAGQRKGAQAIILSLDLAIKDLELKDDALADETKYDDLLNEIRGEKK
jgi:hypothetical protein